MTRRGRAQTNTIEWQGAALPFLTTTAMLAGFCAMLFRFG